jgi:hypothetical protein
MFTGRTKTLAQGLNGPGIKSCGNGLRILTCFSQYLPIRGDYH